ncbi:MAG: hypothetical protein WCS37_20480 [Chloroflexota bacterium]|nr:hypothetical protein [Chloroflexota bacterium]
MTNDEAIEILVACKTLAERASTAFPSGLPGNYTLTPEDLRVLQDFTRVQGDPVVAGPGLLNRLFNHAKLTSVEIYKLEQLRRLVFKRRYLGRNASNGYKSSN